jgi:hypothetical protein
LATNGTWPIEGHSVRGFRSNIASLRRARHVARRDTQLIHAGPSMMPRDRGVDLVTITDHDIIEGALTLAHRDA